MQDYCFQIAVDVQFGYHDVFFFGDSSLVRNDPDNFSSRSRLGEISAGFAWTRVLTLICTIERLWL
jgi:hypothetical protein